jgi:lysozyme family protein
MADFKLFFNRLLQEEGGYVDNPNDPGGPTKYGVTLAEYIRSGGTDLNGDGQINADDIKLLTTNDAFNIAKKDYWDPINGDLINNQSIANFIFDWGYNAGIRTAGRYVQRVLGFNPANIDGIIGPATVNAINSANQENLFNSLKATRESFYRAIAANNPKQAGFLNNWLSRNNSFTYTA